MLCFGVSIVLVGSGGVLLMISMLGWFVGKGLFRVGMVVMIVVLCVCVWLSSRLSRWLLGLFRFMLMMFVFCWIVV